MRARLAFLALALAGCELLGGGISRERAIAIALERAGLSNPVFIDAVVANADTIDWHGGQEPVGQLWLVRFRGTAHACGPAPVPPNPPNQCQDRPAETTVYLDFETGDFISAGTTTDLGP